MKKKNLILLTVALAIFLLSGCRGDPQLSAGENPTPDTPGQTGTETPSAPAPSQTIFTAGTWLAAGDDGRRQYYFFDADGVSGQTSSLENGMGLGFAYEYADGKAVFHMGSVDDITSCSVRKEGDAIALGWENGSTEILTYVSELGAGEFTFYSNEELCDLALDYYRTSTGETGETLTAAAAANEDGTVTIQIYENLGDHNSTAAWYTVDRLTGRGSDANTGALVDLGA